MTVLPRMPRPTYLTGTKACSRVRGLRVSNHEGDEKARAFAREYVRITEALIREGVPEHVARHEARCTAVALVYYDLDDVEADFPED